MPAFAHVITFEMRAGPKATRFGMPYRNCVLCTVQRDGTVYVSGMTNGGVYVPLVDLLAMIRECRRLAPLFGWIGIEWNELQEDGTFKQVHIPIVSKAQRLKLA